MTKKQIIFLILSIITYITSIFIAATAPADVVYGLPLILWFAWVSNVVLGVFVFLMAKNHA